MKRRLAVTRNTIRRDVELPGLMTLCASQLGMLTRERESRCFVVEDADFPAGRHMAGGAICPKLTIMAVISGMARKTIFWSPFEKTVCMTGETSHTHVPAGERKGCGVMIEFCSRPLGRLVACIAVSAELTHMGILGRMAGVAVAWCVREDAVAMTCLAVHIFMGADQWETGRVVIEKGRFPCLCRMTVLTNCAKLTHMRIDLLMA
jgi:hypothetical protein